MARGCGEWRRVMQGECISSIAKDSGHFWQTIWDHMANAELKLRRRQPNMLLPGDAVLVPNKRPKEDPGSTDSHHKYRRRGEPAKLQLRVLEDDQPRANQAYSIEIDGRTFTGTTDAEGRLECPIPGNARHGRLVIGDDQEEYDLCLGCVDPVTEVSGLQTRLNNLAFDCGPADGVLGPRTSAALRGFQSSHGLPATGEADRATLAKLVEAHGS
jgi:hypothetical protein